MKNELTLTKFQLNTAYTQYDIVKEVATKEYGWELNDDPQDTNFNMQWVDLQITAEKLSRLEPGQKINHFPGMWSITRKNLLAKNLRDIQKLFPKEYDFFPQTFLLPTELAAFREAFSGKVITFAIKPQCGSQGKGIYLVKSYENVSNIDQWVAQQYIEKPFLLEGLKFDFRIYVLVSSINPLKIFIHDEGMARFWTVPYARPTGANLKQAYMHLTNYAINKESASFIYNEDAREDDQGHKRSLNSVFGDLEDLGVDVDTVWEQIQQIIVKTVWVARPHLCDQYRSARKLQESSDNSMWFEILGFDILLDNTAKPWLLEVNGSPSFSIETPLDRYIKRSVIYDTLSLLDVPNQTLAAFDKELCKSKARAQWKSNEKLVKFFKQEDQLNWIEAGHTGQYTKIYPAEDRNSFKKFIEAAQRIFLVNNRSQIPVQPLRPRQTFPEPIKLPEIQKPNRNINTPVSSFQQGQVESQKEKPKHQNKTKSLHNLTMTKKPRMIRYPMRQPKTLKGNFLKPKLVYLSDKVEDTFEPTGKLRIALKRRKNFRIFSKTFINDTE